jgi:CubicO group peptidase (beta-lactamase class C family)
MKHKILMAACLVISGLFAQTQTNSDAPALIKKYVSALGGYGNAGQVLIAEGSNVIVNTGYGYAIREKRTPVTNRTIFEVASMSKTFTALAIMKLEMAGKLSVTDTIGKFFSNVPKDKAGITVHQLLTHSSGISGGDLVEDFQPVSKAELCEKIFALRLRAKPGERFMYSNAGFNLLAAIIEKQSGKEYGKYLREAIFSPIGMKNSFVNGESDLVGKPVAYAYKGIKSNKGPDRQVFNVRTWGGGSVCSTVSDLWLLKLALDGTDLLNEEAKRKMFSVQIVISKDNNYGYGCFVYTLGGKKIIDFIGETERGFNSTFRIFTDDNRTFISLSNASQQGGRHNRWFIDARIRNLWMEPKHFPFPPAVNKLAARTLDSYAGKYVHDSSTITVSVQGDNLILQAEGQDAITMLYNADQELENKMEPIREKVAKLMNDYLNKTTTGFAEILTPGNMPDYIAERDQLIAKYGPLKRYRIKDIYPDGPGFMACSILLDFENKQVVFFSLWNIMDLKKIMLDSTVPESTTTTSSFTKIFSNTGPGNFINYNFFTDATDARVTFKTRGGKPVELTNHSGKVVFRKQ